MRNALASNNLKAMKRGDRAFFYHSNIGKEIVGVVEVAREAYPDPTDETGRWVCVDMKAVGPLPQAGHPGGDQGRPGIRRPRFGADVAPFGDAGERCALGQAVQAGRLDAE